MEHYIGSSWLCNFDADVCLEILHLLDPQTIYRVSCSCQLFSQMVRKHKLFKKTLTKCGIKIRFVGFRHCENQNVYRFDPNNVQRALRPQCRVHGMLICRKANEDWSFEMHVYIRDELQKQTFFCNAQSLTMIGAHKTKCFEFDRLASNLRLFSYGKYLRMRTSSNGNLAPNYMLVLQPLQGLPTTNDNDLQHFSKVLVKTCCCINSALAMR